MVPFERKAGAPGRMKLRTTFGSWLSRELDTGQSEPPPQRSWVTQTVRSFALSSRPAVNPINWSPPAAMRAPRPPFRTGRIINFTERSALRGVGSLR